jgi:hypothetical protein
MTDADKYRARADQLTSAIKKRTGKNAKLALRDKQEALRDLANTEDWLDGKTAPQPEK